MKEKILFIVPNLNYGGAEKVTINLFNILNKKKFKKKLFIQNKVGPLVKKIKDKKNIRFFGYSRFLKFIFLLAIDIKKNKYKYVFSSLSHINLALLFLNLTGIIKTKLIVRESNFIKKTITSSKIKMLLLIYYKFLYKKIDIVIASSNTIYKDIYKFTKISKKKIYILYNPIEKIFFKKSLLKIKNTKRKNLNFLSIGRLTKQKNFNKMIKILNKYREYEWNLKIIGDGKQKNYLNNTIKILKLNNKIKIIPMNDKIYDEIVKSDYYLNSSKWEGMPNAVIENIIMKKKIIFFQKIEVYRELKNLFPNQIIYLNDNKFKFLNLYKNSKFENNKNYKLFSEKNIKLKLEKILK